MSRLSVAVRLSLAALGAGLLFQSPAAEVPPGFDVTQGTLDPDRVGLALGKAIPEFRAPDQAGRFRDFASIAGPRGAVIYFHRSADWCVYCRLQLVELEASREALARNGLGLAAISYDSVDVLAAFTAEQGIGYPMLSDSRSLLIREFDILDPTVAAGSPGYGVAVHGALLVNELGTVTGRFFDPNLGHSAGVVLSRLFGSPVNTHEKRVAHDRMNLVYYAGTDTAAPGATVELVLEVSLQDGVHVYAPGGPARYQSVEWEIDPSAQYSVESTAYPQAEQWDIPTLGETAMVYRDRIRLTRSILLTSDGAELRAALDTAETLAINGSLRVQACDEATCYAVRRIPLQWKLRVPVASHAEHRHH